ncbi:hypothetical protein [Luteolibacter luteus]|uniref:von Hippel-Lindau disease tumour suppressor beta domain-containing protein n=1 Tax=Luteolibacter luteus TaxID=2728835 RepID=A0A858RHR7_9BACT|nr:hypothetical protein [Luteolibacter luteus]QJE96255.1 hypothetical protein HHL09_10825 [Luteolibacter luteus]
MTATISQHIGRIPLVAVVSLWLALPAAPGFGQDPAPATREAFRKHPEEIQGAKSRPGGKPSSISFVNNTADPVRIYWLDDEGKRDSRPGAGELLQPGKISGMNATAGAAFVVTDPAGNGLEFHYAEEKSYRVEIGGPRVNFAIPERKYEEVTCGQWMISIEQSLLETDAAAAEKASKRLATNLDRILGMLPAHSHGAIKSTRLFIMQGKAAPGGGFDSGLEYIADKQPEYVRSLDPKWNHAMIIYSARNYADLSDLWAMKAPLHEMAHSYHASRWPQDQPDIEGAWKNAVLKGLYRQVKDCESGAMIDAAYAITNGLEYFAELSTCYFSRINYPPEDRAGLKAYDPEGYEMIRKMWEVKDP